MVSLPAVMRLRVTFQPVTRIDAIYIYTLEKLN